MTRQLVTHDRLLDLVSYDKETGVFVSNIQRGTKKKGDTLGYLDKSTGYIVLEIDHRPYYAHRLAWFFIHGEWPDRIDHIDRSRSNNKLSNLRDVSQTVNLQNIAKPPKHSGTGVLGAHTKGNRYRSSIVVQGRKINLGAFGTLEEAHAAYITAKRKLHPGCTI